MSLRKFAPGQPEQVADQYMRNTTKAEYLWKTSSLEQQEGTGARSNIFDGLVCPVKVMSRQPQ